LINPVVQTPQKTKTKRCQRGIVRKPIESMAEKIEGLQQTKRTVVNKKRVRERSGESWRGSARIKNYEMAHKP
jgi:hypothetical protein